MREVIESRLADGFEKALFEAALNNLQSADNPLRFNNFAYAMRELVRHVLKRLAPDEEVLKCSWYADETGRENGISRKQRVYFAVQGGLSDDYVTETLGLDISEIHKSLKGAVDNLSKHTHIEENTFDISEDQISAFVDETLVSVSALFEAIDDSHHRLTSALWEQIDEATIDTALSETILSIDEISSHHFIEEIYTDKVLITRISNECIEFEALGSVGCKLQWGWGGDLRRGDGAVLSESFPFTCRLWSFVEEPNAIQTDEDAFSVDTSSWWEGYYDEDPR